MASLTYQGNLWEWPDNDEGLRKATDFAKAVGMAHALVFKPSMKPDMLKFAQGLLASKGPAVRPKVVDHP